MSHIAPEVDTRDTLGKTQHFNGTVGLTSALVPSTPQGKLGSVLVRNPNSNGVTEVLYVSFDGGTTYLSLSRGEFAGWYPKSNSSGTPIQQVRVLGSTADVNYEIIMDFEV